MSRRRRKPKRRARRSSRALPALPVLEQRHYDLIGLGLVAFGAFMGFVFYFGWAGGEVGEAAADGLRDLFGKVAYVVPVALVGAGAVLVLRPVLPAVRPFRSGGACLALALLIGLASGSLGLGGDGTPRERAGIVGAALDEATTTLVGDVGTTILFLFLLVTGALLLTGGSVAGIVSATRERVTETGRRVRRTGTSRTAARRAAGEAATSVLAAGPQPEAADDEEATTVPDVEPVVRATHVEAPALDAEQRYPDLFGDDEADDDEEAAEEPAALGDEAADDEDDAGLDPQTADEHDEDEEVRPRLGEIDPSRLTPQGRLRGSVTEADDFVYRLPKPSLLKRTGSARREDPTARKRTGAQLIEALGHFGVEAQLVGTVSGPHVTRYELRLAPGTKMSKVANLKDDLAYALAARDVRILAPIPGKQAVGVEVPNEVRLDVTLGDVFQEPPKGWSPLTVWLGKDIAGRAIGTDIAKQPHLLVAGTTGSGKSVCVNGMLCSILMRATPNDVRLVLVDPKQVELNYYESIPHLLTPVITSPRLAANALQNLVREMEERYSIMSLAKTRNITELNRIRREKGQKPLPYILCVIDELADLMMIAPGEVEDSIIRLAQKSRAVGIHLLLATQRPSADIITGMIKANVPARIAFAVSSQIDSRVILDQNGAESLLGQGDMLFRPATESKPSRIQGAFITEEEIVRLTDHWRRQGEPEHNEELLEAVESEEEDDGGREEFHPDQDDLLPEAIQTVVQMGTASTSMLQRRLRVGYTRAGRLIDMMERRGVISGYEGSKARKVLITEADLPRVLEALDEPVGAASGEDDA